MTSLISIKNWESQKPFSFSVTKLLFKNFISQLIFSFDVPTNAHDNAETLFKNFTLNQHCCLDNFHHMSYLIIIQNIESSKKSTNDAKMKTKGKYEN